MLVLCPRRAVDALIVILGDPSSRQRTLIRVCAAHRRPACVDCVAGWPGCGKAVEVQAESRNCAAVRLLKVGNRVITLTYTQPQTGTPFGCGSPTEAHLSISLHFSTSNGSMEANNTAYMRISTTETRHIRGHTYVVEGIPNGKRESWIPGKIRGPTWHYDGKVEKQNENSRSSGSKNFDVRRRDQTPPVIALCRPPVF